MGLAVLRAAAHVGREPFVVVTGDELLDRDAHLVARMVEEQARHGGITLAVAAVDDADVPLSDMCGIGAEVDDGVLEVTDVVKRPALRDAPSRFALVGRYVLPPEIFDVLGDVRADAGGEVQLPDAMVALLRRGVPVHAVRYDGARHDVATTWGLLTTSITLGLRDPVTGPRLADWLAQRLGASQGAGGSTVPGDVRSPSPVG